MVPTLYWFRSQREAYDVHRRFALPRLKKYQELAHDVGLEMRVVDVDDFVVSCQASGETSLLFKGEVVPRDRSVFHTVIVTAPAYLADARRHLAFFSILERAGYCTTVPALLSLVNADKLLTLLQPFGPRMKVLPTTKVMTRQFGFVADYLDASKIEYPLAVKPANWSAGLGIFRVSTEQELNSVLQLAGAGEVPMVIQPWIEGLVDYRLYFVHNELRGVMRREPHGAAIVANVGQGGDAFLTDAPAGLMELAAEVVDYFGLPYLCVDFVSDGREFWLSEIEMDGGVPAQEEFYGIVRERLAAYKNLLTGRRTDVA